MPDTISLFTLLHAKNQKKKHQAIQAIHTADPSDLIGRELFGLIWGKRGGSKNPPMAIALATGLDLIGRGKMGRVNYTLINTYIQKLWSKK